MTTGNINHKNHKNEMKANVTYIHVNEEEAEYGDSDRRGFIAEGISIRDAIDLLGDEMSEVQSIDSSNYPVSGGGWISATGRNWETGDDICNSIHLEKPISDASMERLIELIKG